MHSSRRDYLLLNWLYKPFTSYIGASYKNLTVKLDFPKKNFSAAALVIRKAMEWGETKASLTAKRWGKLG
jgi:hypothetical protein